MLWRWTGDMHCRLVWFSCCWNKSNGTNHNTKIQCSCKDVIHLVKSSLQTMVVIDTWFKDLKSEIRCQNIELLAINCVQSLASQDYAQAVLDIFLQQIELTVQHVHIWFGTNTDQQYLHVRHIVDSKITTDFQIQTVDLKIKRY